MTREEWQRLLDGYATGTLTPAEERALLEASLNDQELFDAMVREQALRDLLSQPEARSHLLRQLEPRRKRRWWWAPAGLAVAASACVAIILLREKPFAEKPVMVAGMRQREDLPRAAPPEVAAPAAPAREAGPPKSAAAPAREKEQRAEPPREEVAARRDAEAARDAAAAGPAPAVSAGAGAAKGEGGAALRKSGQTAEQAEVAMRAAALPPPAASTPPPSVAKSQLTAPGAVAESLQIHLPGPDVGSAPAGRAKRATRTLKVAASPSPVRCVVEVRNAAGEFAEAAPGTSLKLGDAVRLRCQSGETGYLTVWHRAASGAWRRLAGERVERDVPAVVPLPAMAPGAAGRQHLYVFLHAGASAPPEAESGPPDPRAPGAIVTLDYR